MALGEPDRTPLDIFRDRVQRAALVFLLTLAHLAFFSLVMFKHPVFGIPTTPFVCLVYWRLVALLVTGSQFTITLNYRPKTTQDLFSVVFTVLSLINMMAFLCTLAPW